MARFLELMITVATLVSSFLQQEQLLFFAQSCSVTMDHYFPLLASCMNVHWSKVRQMQSTRWFRHFTRMVVVFLPQSKLEFPPTQHLVRLRIQCSLPFDASLFNHIAKLAKLRSLSLYPPLGKENEDPALFRFPPNLTELKLKGLWNGMLPLHALPPTLSILKFGHEFNQPIQKLPDSLEHLSFGIKFNQALPPLPKGLRSLTFVRKDWGSFYNQPLPELPEGLQCLDFGSNFNQRLPVPLPRSLQILSFGRQFNQPLPDLPSSLEILHLRFEFDQPLPNLPAQLHSLELGHRFNHPIGFFPPNLKFVTFGNLFNRPLPDLPSALLKLHLGNDFNQPLPALPQNLLTLKLGIQFDQTIAALPTSLLALNFPLDSNFRQPLILPLKLEWLSLPNRYTRTIVLPPSLRKLFCGDAFAERLTPEQLRLRQ